MTAENPPLQASQLRRRRRSSLGAAAADSHEAAGSAISRGLLLLWDDLPNWRRDNAFIRSGYRAESNTYLGSFRSLGGLHNETVNIWSHLLGAVFLSLAGLYLHALVAPRYASASGSDVLVFGAFFAGALGCLGMSASYHAVSNHSQEVARWGNKLDYTGIVLLIEGSYVPSLYYGLFCRPGLMSVYLYMISLLSLGCIIVSWFEYFRKPEWRSYRALIFVGLGLSSVFPVVHGLLLYGYSHLNERMGLSWVLLQGFLYIFGALVYAIRWPERLVPGRFDIWGSSHQIFHFLVLLAAASHLRGMAKAFDFHHGLTAGMECRPLG